MDICTTQITVPVLHSSVRCLYWSSDIKYPPKSTFKVTKDVFIGIKAHPIYRDIDVAGYILWSPKLESAIDRSYEEASHQFVLPNVGAENSSY